jgi:NAD(P)-dependent dehydrogenase (short-subunit alcohol dehydrogenase family)
MRVVVVGASSGLGRHIGIDLARRGARVALLARSQDRLAEAAQEAGPGTITVSCDVTKPAECKAAVEKAAGELGGIDALLYATGAGPLAPIESVDAETWRGLFDTNVIGASLVTAAALPYLAESGGTAAYLSSISASQTAPWPGLGGYVVSKAALDKLIEAWQVEHPRIGFTRISVGNSLGGSGGSQTRFSDGWDPALVGDYYQSWVAREYLNGSFVDPDELARVVYSVLDNRNGTVIPTVVVMVRPPAS